MSAIDDALASTLERLRGLGLGDAFDPRAAQAIVEGGLHRLTVPVEAGGLGASMVEAVEVLAAIGAVDGSTALGFAMQVHVVAAMRDADGFPEELRARLYRAIVDDGALLNNASTEEGGGSPARGAIPGTVARQDEAGGWRLTGEKTWTTWLPNLTHAFVSARIAGDAGDAGGQAPRATRPATWRILRRSESFLVDLAEQGVERRDGFARRWGLGLGASGSRKFAADLVQRRRSGEPDPRGPAPLAWFGAAIAGDVPRGGGGCPRERRPLGARPPTR